MRHVPPQVLRKIMQHRARRADGRAAILQPEAIERRDFEMFAHGELRGFRREHPIFVGVQNRKLVLQQLHASGALPPG